MGDIIPDFPDSAMSREDRLDDILILWEDAAKRGQPLTPEEACHSDPALLPDFKTLLSKLGLIQPILNGEAALASPEDLVGRVRAGRFKPVRYHDAGGIGMVYIADDTELNRAVALKCMQTLASLDPTARERFTAEAEITGKLEHPGIVPVYGLGQDADGRPYYAMRFIHGATLGSETEKLHRDRGHQSEAEWNVEFRRLLRSFVSVCQTIAYAHARGVIHRDIKPANVMLGPYGETLVVDWGLAKRCALPDPDDSVDPGYQPVALTAEPAGQTIYGRAKGSPAFMAPEQARGEWDKVGLRSDVYSLGATLYVLLTGRKPYTGNSSEEVIQAVKAGELARPRQHWAGVPRALEAVCLKAMAADPAARYGAAKELADDVDRWLAGEPVMAYPEPFTMRAKRWVRRHQTAVSTSVAAVFVAAVLLTVLGIVLGAKNQELTQANTNLDNANRQLGDSFDARQADFEESDFTLRGIMENVFARGAASPDPSVHELRADAVRQYRDYFARFIDRNKDRPEVRLEVALARVKLGEMHAFVGSYDEALAAYTEGERDFERLSEEAPDDRNNLFGLGSALGQRGSLLNFLGRFREAEPLLVRSRDLFEQLSRDPNPIRVARYSSDGLGAYVDSPAMRLANVTLELTLQARVKQLSRPPQLPGSKAVPNQQVEWARTAYRVITGGRDLPPDAPVMVQLRALALKMYVASADATAVSEAEVRAALARMHELINRYPLLTELRQQILAAEICLANAARAAGKPEEADRHLESVVGQAYRLETADLGLDTQGFRELATVTQADAWFDRARLALERNNHLGAQTYESLARKSLEKLSPPKKLRPETTVQAMQLYVKMAAQAATNPLKRADAEAYFTAAVKLVESLPREAGNGEVLDGLRLIFYCGIAGQRGGQGKPGGDALAKANELAKSLRVESSNDPLLRAAQVQLHNVRGMEASQQRRDYATALAEYRAAARLAHELVQADPGDSALRFQASTMDVLVAVSLGMMAEQRLKGRTGGDPEALALIREALPMLRKLKSEKYDDPELQQLSDYMAARCGQAIREFEALEKQAAGKK